MKEKCVTEAKLEGFNGPYFPEGIIHLHKALSCRTDLMRYQIEEIASRLPEFNKRQQNLLASNVTSDKYDWCYVVLLRLKGRHLAILFPWRGAGGKKDRMSAVYAEEGITEEQMDEITKSFCNKAIEYLDISRLMVERRVLNAD